MKKITVANGNGELLAVGYHSLVRRLPPPDLAPPGVLRQGSSLPPAAAAGAASAPRPVAVYRKYPPRLGFFLQIGNRFPKPGPLVFNPIDVGFSPTSGFKIGFWFLTQPSMGGVYPC